MRRKQIPPIVTLTTDFGTRDFYVGAMKGIILGIEPLARVVDISHEIGPFDVLHGAYILRHALPCYPPGTIHVAVIDPGVGSDRRILLAGYRRQFVIAPDNGLISLLHHDFTPEAMFIVENKRYALPNVSSTFHGRDIMAPAAGHLASGVRPHELGRHTDHIEVLDAALGVSASEAEVRGRGIYADRFGNIATNIHSDHLAGIRGSADTWNVRVNDQSIGPVRATFSNVEAGDAVAIMGSTGMLEIGVNLGSALERFGAVSEVCVVVLAGDD